MTRAHVRVVLAAVVACAPALVGASIASATPGTAPSTTSETNQVATTLVDQHQPLAKRAPKVTPLKSETVRDLALPSVGSQARQVAAAKAAKAKAAKLAAAKAAKAARERATRAAARRAARSGSRCVPPRYVAGLNSRQTYNAEMIIKAGQHMDMGRRGEIVALSTALRETNLKNYANWNVPVSLDLKHEAVGHDHDSLGLFQQRPIAPWGAGDWGTPRELMTPYDSASKFYQALQHVHHWQDLPVTVAAQRVQVSAFPNAYAPMQPEATAIVNDVHCTP